jgi:FKBP-type peptidyl-prolyl cis-trans isomerase FkpA
VRAIVRYLPLLALFCVASACTSESVSDAGSAGNSLSATDGVPETEEQKILNALGQTLAQNVVSAGLSAEDFAFVQRGFSDAVLGQDAFVELSEYGPKIQAFMEQQAAGAAEGELALATAFVEEQASIEGTNRTESGIVVQEITAGSGATPTADDTVQVHYHGTLRDGTVFDSSVDRGEPATFPLAGVIPCWSEGLQHISVGGKSRLVCPPDLAYGPQGPPGIPGNAALVFEVELLDIVQN